MHLDDTVQVIPTVDHGSMSFKASHSSLTLSNYPNNTGTGSHLLSMLGMNTFTVIYTHSVFMLLRYMYKFHFCYHLEVLHFQVSNKDWST